MVDLIVCSTFRHTGLFWRYFSRGQHWDSSYVNQTTLNNTGQLITWIYHQSITLSNRQGIKKATIFIGYDISYMWMLVAIISTELNLLSLRKSFKEINKWSVPVRIFSQSDNRISKFWIGLKMLCVWISYFFFYKCMVANFSYFCLPIR